MAGEEAFTAARKAGQALSLEETIAEALDLADALVGLQNGVHEFPKEATALLLQPCTSLRQWLATTAKLAW
jgi:hypothetical protein